MKNSRMNYYNDISRGYLELYKEEQLRKIKLILKKIKIEGKVLDVGAGPCLLNNFFDTVCIDPSIELLKLGSGKRIVGIAEELPFNDKEFDYVFCVTAVHNFKDIEKGLEEIKRVGKNYIITVLKKSPKYDRIVKTIKKKFNVIETIDDETDKIFVLK